MQRPLYMQPQDAIEYGIIDQIIKSETQEDLKLVDDVKSPEQWDHEVRSIPYRRRRPADLPVSGWHSNDAHTATWELLVDSVM